MSFDFEDEKWGIYLRTGITGRERRGGGGGTPDSFADCKLLCSMVMIRLLCKLICCGTI